MRLNKSTGRMFKSVDYTATYYQGCNHGCKFCWTLFMPGGPINHEPRLMQTNEFETIPIMRLNEDKEAVVFLNSAHDTFADCIPDEWILAMLRWIGRQPEGLVFYLQSQNVWRALVYMSHLKEIQDKVIIGTTIQTDNEELIKKFSDAPTIYNRYAAMRRFGTEGFRLRLSLEPLFAFNYYDLRKLVLYIRPELVEVGLDNYAGRHKLDIPQPRRGLYEALREDMINAGIEVVEKKGMEKWRTGKR